VPFAPDVLQWHHDEIVELPAGAVLLAASTRYPHQAFRMGERAWGVQFHIECDAAMMAHWAAANTGVLADLGYDPDELVAATEAVLGEIEDTWQPFAWRFAALALGRLETGPDGRPVRPELVDGARRQLPLLGQ
jgi:hypothetical protein